MKRNKVFISYSHQDASWLLRLRVHLRPLEREYEIEFWDDTKIKPGSKWKQEIQAALAGAQIAILLISADFLASDFIVTNELPPLLEAAEKDGAVILSVIVSPSRFLKTSLAQYQAVNNPNNSLIKLSKGEQEDVFVDVAERIELALESSPSLEPQYPYKATFSEDSKVKDKVADRSVDNKFLDGVPFIIYYEDARDEAKHIWSFLVSKGMLLNKYESGLGIDGPKTIVHSLHFRNIADWLKENIEEFHDFKIIAPDPDDDFNGIIINLW